MEVKIVKFLSCCLIGTCFLEVMTAEMDVTHITVGVCSNTSLLLEQTSYSNIQTFSPLALQVIQELCDIACFSLRIRIGILYSLVAELCSPLFVESQQWLDE